MESETPGQGAGSDQPEPASPSAPEPAWTTPPPPTSAGVGPSTGSWGAAPQQPAAPAAQQPSWGQPAAQAPWGGAPQQPAPQWGAPSSQPAQPAWGQQPAAAAPQDPGWGQQPAAPGSWAAAPQQPTPPQPAPQQPAWSPAPQQPAGQGSWGGSAQPPAPQQPGWGQPPQQAPAQPGPWGAPAPGPGYGAPPPQAPSPQPGWNQPGQPQPGWSGGPPAPVKGGMSGCLKGCLIVGVLLIVLVVIAVVALGALGASFFNGIGIDSNGNLKDCSIVSSQQLQTVLGPDTEAHPLSGLANAAIGVTLDKRVLPDADNCYILSGAGATASSDQLTGGYGRIAKYSGDASGTFNKELQNAKSGGYFATDVSGAGDQAFCTGWSDKYPATGALVRKGSDLVYVSLLIGSNFNFDQSSTAGGVPFSQSACDQAVQIANLALH